ncbi:MAG TPA: hypothetical protein PJ986_02095 [Gammaproteobacteria bacterium]|nr:hypothetical protein [Gammaproteobacteria bacterium]
MPKSKHRRKNKPTARRQPASSKVTIVVNFYGPNDTLATKMVAAAYRGSSGERIELKRWIWEAGGDIRNVDSINDELVAFCAQWKVERMVSPERIIGCPHEEGIDYPIGEACPRCPWWHGRDRFTGELLKIDDEGEERG